jgi:hypothetical protein
VQVLVCDAVNVTVDVCVRDDEHVWENVTVRVGVYVRLNV